MSRNPNYGETSEQSNTFLMPQFTYRNETYDYTINRSDRKTLGIYVHPDLTIEIKAPLSATEPEIAERVHKRRSWIVRQLQEFSLYHPLRRPPVYKNGATHLYLGRQYRLRIQEAEKNQVKLKGGYLEVSHHPSSTPEKALTAWYKEKADEWFPRVLDEVYPRFRSYDIPKPEIVHKAMKKRWGSCKVSKQSILLNTELIQGPKVGIEYVIAHELTHLIYPHHTAAFYATMDRVLPEWRRWKERLERVMA